MHPITEKMQKISNPTTNNIVVVKTTSNSDTASTVSTSRQKKVHPIFFDPDDAVLTEDYDEEEEEEEADNDEYSASAGSYQRIRKIVSRSRMKGFQRSSFESNKSGGGRRNSGIKYQSFSNEGGDFDDEVRNTRRKDQQQRKRYSVLYASKDVFKSGRSTK